MDGRERGWGEQGTELREEECGVARGDRWAVSKILKDTRDSHTGGQADELNFFSTLERELRDVDVLCLE